MDGPVCVGAFVALDMLASRKQRRKGLARKMRLARARRRQIFVQRQARERLFFTLVLSMLALTAVRLPEHYGGRKEAHTGGTML